MYVLIIALYVCYYYVYIHVYIQIAELKCKLTDSSKPPPVVKLPQEPSDESKRSIT